MSINDNETHEEEGETRIAAGDLIASVLTSVINGVLSPFAARGIPPTILADVVMNVAAYHVAEMMNGLIEDETISMEKAKTIINGTGKAFQVILSEIFENRENYFNKKGN